MGGGDRSLTTVTRSHLRARASTLHQLTGWLMSSDADTEGTCEFSKGEFMQHFFNKMICSTKYQNPSNIKSSLTECNVFSLRGVLMSSQQGPLIFLLRRKCSRLEVLVPKMWENVAPLRSEGSDGNSACKKKKQCHRTDQQVINSDSSGPLLPHSACLLTEYLTSRYSH